MTEMRKFRLHWLDGKKETITGQDVSDAMRRAGYGNGALRALDYWEDLYGSEHLPANEIASNGDEGR